MIDETYIHLITGYLQGTLTSTEKEQLQMLIKEGRIDPAELKELENTYLEIGSLKTPEPRPNNKMPERFYFMLEAEKTALSGKFTTRVSVWIQRFQAGFVRHKMGYATALFIAGFLAGNLFSPLGNRDQKIEQLTAEVHQVREMMMINLLENESSAERLRAVNISNEIPASGNRVAEALLQTLNRDPNVNVRIAAVDALINHASSPAVRRGMIESITRQESPLVQIALADAMIALQEREAVDQFIQLLEQDDMDNNVRNKIENTILALN